MLCIKYRSTDLHRLSPSECVCLPRRIFSPTDTIFSHGSHGMHGKCLASLAINLTYHPSYWFWDIVGIEINHTANIAPLILYVNSSSITIPWIPSSAFDEVKQRVLKIKYDFRELREFRERVFVREYLWEMNLLFAFDCAGEIDIQ